MWNVAGQLLLGVLGATVAYFGKDFIADTRDRFDKLDNKIEKLASNDARLEAKLDAKFDALIHSQLLDRVARLEDDRMSSSRGK
ncbi:hypothetical protein MNEG_13196 [Monoraphidium neglectum]|jgi:hypothetical protein|uniref:Uncharacterized protein n=1 Tax=Monoraphidium neglectum TaxID=145388 RepID=A0A0D2MIF8_9CHLO|nr:hypothetical protein MNEG_13196 [Monoraphidium neglectum]KIY94765.1 hypothetical protein MNEG_13196 [Monoraphidium neglectum]|eukprot:XP_013893785.1 hypothetical protein MNEG_13196 [Monoraphidium neglectum]